MVRLNQGLRKRLFGGLVALAIVAAASIPFLNALAASSNYTITYVNGSTSYTKTYDAGSVVILDALPSGAIAWTDDNSSAAPNRKMAYVNYDHTDTVNGVSKTISVPMSLVITDNMTLTANYGSYANGQQGPRLIQLHLELKFFDMTNNVFMGFEPHYNNINAPSGYYVALPPANYFGDELYAQINSSGGLVNTGQAIANWVNDSSYTGTASESADKIFAPGALIYVDPNNYNMIYNTMVNTTYNPNFAQTLPPDAPANPDSPAQNTGTDTITFRISQVNIPPASTRTDLLGYPAYPVYGGTFILPWPSYQSPDNFPLMPPNLYLNWYSGQSQLTVSGLQDSQPWTDALPYISYDNFGYAIPVAVSVTGYTFYWTLDGVPLPTYAPGGNDGTLANYFNNNPGLVAQPIGGSHVFTLQYVPIPQVVNLVIAGHTDSVVYDGTSHSVSGYDVYSCPTTIDIDTSDLIGEGCVNVGTSAAGEDVALGNGDVVSFANAGGNSNLSATGTDVGTYPIALLAGSFTVSDDSGENNTYNITAISGGLTITKKPIIIIVDPPIDPNTQGTGNTSTVTPQDPSDLAPGQTIVTPNGDGTITSNTGDGDVTYIDPNTGDPMPYDPSKPNGGLIVITDPSNVDPGTGKPTDVTDNYDVNNVIPKPKPGNDNSDDNTGGDGGAGDNGSGDPNAPDTGIVKFAEENVGVVAPSVAGVCVVLVACGGILLARRKL